MPAPDAFPAHHQAQHSRAASGSRQACCPFLRWSQRTLACAEGNPALSTQLQPDIDNHRQLRHPATSRFSMLGRRATLSIVAPLRGVDPFVYEPLDPLRDCTRVVEIEPCGTWNVGDQTALDLRCQVKQVFFSDRPKYRALSYMWGDEAVRIPIFLNGKRFTVAENLFRALGYLRLEKIEGPFWIDAICINQDDIHEKNRQIRIMPHIYFRASAVLVWLGLYTSDQVVGELCVRQGPWSSFPPNARSLTSARARKTKTGRLRHSFLTVNSNTPALNDATLRLLGDCGYWQRLWVVQEIGKAASIQVCYATSHPDPSAPGGFSYRNHFLPWDDFIVKIQSLARESDRAGALRLDAQLKEKDKGSHTLRSLLEAHHGALCKNPRDKVYGLAGLAEDCYGFPVDYAKSLFEVWADTLHFLQEGGQVGDDADLPGLAGIMMNALGGPTQVMPPPGTSSSVVLELHLLLVGTMTKIGPTPDDIISSLGAGDDWAATIQRSDKHAPQHNEKVIREILQMENPSTPLLTVDPLTGVGTTCLVWLPRQRMKGACADLIQLANLVDIPHRKKCGASSSQIYLVLTCVPPGRDRCWIGIAAGDFTEGDLFCSIPGTSTTLLLRTTRREGRRTAPGDDGYVASVVGVVAGADHRRAFGVGGSLNARNSLSIHISADALFKTLYTNQARYDRWHGE